MNDTINKFIHILWVFATDPQVRTDINKFIADVKPILTANGVTLPVLPPT